MVMSPLILLVLGLHEVQQGGVGVGTAGLCRRGELQLCQSPEVWVGRALEGRGEGELTTLQRSQADEDAAVSEVKGRYGDEEGRLTVVSCVSVRRGRG